MITVLGDVAQDVHVRITGRLPAALVVGGDTPARIQHLPGGSAAGTAAWLSTTRTRVRLISSIGRDHAGAHLRAILEKRGVEACLEIQDLPTSTVTVLVDDSGERSMLPDPGASAALTEAWCRTHVDGSHLHVSGYAFYRESTRAAVVAALGTAHERGMTASIDLNSHGLVTEHRALITRFLPRFDVVLSNSEEFTALDVTPADHADTTFVVTSGASGARWSRGAASGGYPAIPVTVVDTVGAGDAFAAGFLASWVSGMDVTQALQAGHTLAAECVTRVGAGPVPPD